MTTDEKRKSFGEAAVQVGAALHKTGSQLSDALDSCESILSPEEKSKLEDAHMALALAKHRLGEVAISLGWRPPADPTLN